MNVQIIHPQDQGKGEFDGGKIQEQKPIGFPGEGSAIIRLGPLFYWAWAHAETKSGLGLHPHQGFEIMTYGIAGQGVHKDTLGSESILGAGDIQLMQTGSGVSHSEGIEAGFEGFQIWFEPYLNEAVKRVPTYSLFKHEQFPVVKQDGVEMKTILGDDSPIHLVTDAQMIDLKVDDGSSYTYRLLPNRFLAGLAIRGGGSFSSLGKEATSFEHKDFLVFQSEDEDEIVFQANGENLRIVLIDIPEKVDYPLYQKRR
ncbi:pirin family protein [Cohnella silvisoli]|uniref:Pirin family protein n=1 Tax=Cohnella silvisoli TaxID=2873699 RepID=A0ABV1KT47_9BACL|nr:pirin family protein [Cohnella silvisoli]MCD9021526.1 pirin family protein [Cohnella silvisoli]